MCLDFGENIYHFSLIVGHQVRISVECLLYIFMPEAAAYGYYRDTLGDQQARA